ncbi:hypothetical protein SISSUDRAFT_1051932, partial [Sistotremastrum suecicum HHB10207 ss-3]
MQVFSPSLISHTFSAAAAPLLIDAGLDSQSVSSPEDSLLHPLLRRVEEEAYRLASDNERESIQEADWYMLNIQNKIWNSLSVVRAHVNATLNRRIPIARLPPEIIAKTFEFYLVEWFEKFQFAAPLNSGQFSPNLYPSRVLLRREWFAILQVCQTWRDIVTTTPTLFTTIDLDWHPSIVDFFWRCSGTKLPLCIHIPEFSHRFRVSLGILCQTRTEDNTELLRDLISRTQELHIRDVISFSREFPDGFHASAPLLRSLTIKMVMSVVDELIIPEDPMTVVVDSGDLRNHLFRDMTAQLQTLELSGLGFTKDWLACVSLTTVSVHFGDDWYQLTREASPFTHLAELPNLEILYFSDSQGTNYSTTVVQMGSVLTFNRLHTLTFLNIVDGTLRSAFTWLDLPALRQFNLLCGYQRHNHYIRKRADQSDPFFMPWECTWLHRILERATHIRLSLDGPNNVHTAHERQNSGDDYATLVFTESSSDDVPSFKMTLDGTHGFVPVNKDSEYYDMLFATLTHCLRHWVASVTSMLITGISTQKNIPRVAILLPFFQRCRDLTSLAVKNCNAGRIITALSSGNMIDVAAPAVRKMQLHGCSLNPAALGCLLREREASGLVVTEI